MLHVSWVTIMTVILPDSQLEPSPHWVKSTRRPPLSRHPPEVHPSRPPHLLCYLEPHPARLEGHQVDVQVALGDPGGCGARRGVDDDVECSRHGAKDFEETVVDGRDAG